MRADVLSQFRRLEEEILSRDLTPDRGSGPAVPVGLRFDRLAREGYLPPPSRPEEDGPGDAAGHSEQAGRHETARDSRAGAYWKANRLAVAALLEGSGSVLVKCEESWAGELPLTAVRAVGPPTAAGPVQAPAGAAPTPQAGPFDAVLADSSILLRGELAETLSGFRRVLRNDGRVVLLVANWEYEMEGEAVGYDLSFKRYGGKVYAGLVKRTLDPALEVEYVCLLDQDDPSVRDMARLPRDRLRLMGMRDVPELGRLVVAAEVIRIPQATVRSLEAAGKEAGFSRGAVAGAPGAPGVPAADSPHLLAVFVE